MESKEQSLRVAVVGAGLAGLGAAWQLSRAGCDVVLLEARSAAGGRAASREEEGFALDCSSQILTSRSQGMLRFINQAGLTDQLLPLRPLRTAQIHAGEAKGIEPRTLLGAASIPGVRWIDRPKLLRFERLLRRYRPLLDLDQPEKAAPLDYRSTADFARLYLGESLFERWIAPAACSAFLDDEAELSRVAFLLAWVAEEDATVGLVRGGLHRLTRHAEEQLSARKEVRVDVVEQASEGTFKLHCESKDGAETLEADAVIVATDAAEGERICRSLLVPAERDFFSTVDFSPLMHLSIALDRPLAGVPLQVRVPHTEGAAIETHLVEPGAASGRAPTGCGLVTAFATREFSESHWSTGDDVVQKALIAELERWYPRISEIALFARFGRRERAIPHFRVGAYRALERFQNVQRDRRAQGRRLYFAGDYLAGPSLEAGHRSGERAAAALIQDLVTS